MDLTIGMGEIKPGYYQQTSAPLVAGDRVVVVGGRVADNFATGEPPGATYMRGTPNVWAAMSFDSKLNLIYLPTGNATPDFFGGGRSALDDKYSSSVVAVDASTGGSAGTFRPRTTICGTSIFLHSRCCKICRTAPAAPRRCWYKPASRG